MWAFLVPKFVTIAFQYLFWPGTLSLKSFCYLDGSLTSELKFDRIEINLSKTNFYRWYTKPVTIPKSEALTNIQQGLKTSIGWT